MLIPEHPNWPAAVVDDYEAELRQLDSEGRATDALVARLTEIRHLHHGVYGQGANRSMMDRYDALRALESDQMNLQFVCDIPAFLMVCCDELA